MKANFILLPALLLLSFYCPAQYKRLTIGDKVPDVVFNSVRNYSGTTKRLSDFKGKYIILDFWDRTCTSCIEGMPKMERLQEQFKDNLQIILITKNNETGLAQLFQNSVIVKNVKLPMVLADTVLTKHLFPYMFLPRHIWLDREGKVLAITQAGEAIPENITNMIAGKKLQLTTREDIVDENELQELFGETTSILTANNSRYLKYLCYFNSSNGRLNNRDKEMADSNISYSLLTKRIAGAKEYDVMFFRGTNGGETGMRLINTNLKSLYRYAFQYGGDLKYKIPGKLLVEPGVFTPEPKDPAVYNKWVDETSYCFETKFPESSSDKAQSRLKESLEEYFGVTAEKEERSLKCFVFYQDTTGKLNYAKENEPSYSMNMGSEKGMLFSNMQFHQIFDYVMYSYSSDKMPPIINETGLATEKLTMTLHINNFENLELLNTDLRTYGLKIKEEMRTIQVLVLKKMVR